MTNLNEQLIEAIINNGIDEVLELIEKGADVRARSQWGKTPLHYACSYGRTELVLKLIKKGADIGASDKWGQTPLHYACVYGNSELALMLIEKGADVGARTNGGSTPFDWASEELKGVLREKGIINN